MRTLIEVLFGVWYAGFFAGFGLYLFKYCDYILHRDYYLSDKHLRELYIHDHQPMMIVRNWLFYCCLSWYGVWSFIVKDD